MGNSIDFLAIFEEIIEKIRNEYLSYNFFTERDFEWTVQKYFGEFINKNNLPYEIFNNHPIAKGKIVDLAVVNKGTSYRAISQRGAVAEFIIEFKFEPSMRRSDFCDGKLEQAVCFWSEISKDIERINHFVEEKKTKSAVAVLVDEFGRFRNKEISSQSRWIDWGSFGNDLYNVSLLWTSLPEKSLD